MEFTEHFWYDGHHGHIECAGRERYVAYLNGDEFDRGGQPASMKENMLTEMKYRQERDPDFSMVCYGILRFCDAHVPGHNDENDWVLFDAITEEVMLNDPYVAQDAMYALEDAGLIEYTRAYDTPNYQFLLRPTVDEYPEPEDLSISQSDIWTYNE